MLKRARVRLTEALRAGGRNASAGRDRNITRNTLTIVQVALALVLLIGSGLMIRTFQSMRRVQPGFTDPGTLQTLQIAIPATSPPTTRGCWSCSRAWSMRLASLPGVSSVSLMDGLPMTGFSSQDPIFASDHSYAARHDPAAAPLHPDGTGHVPGTGHTAGRWSRVRLDRHPPEAPGRADQRRTSPVNTGARRRRRSASAFARTRTIPGVR